MPVRIVLAEDQPIVCRGIGALTHSANIEIAAVVTSADQILPAIQLHQPNVLVTEVRLKDQDALKFVEEMGESPCSVVVFSASTNPTNIARASALGCHDFVPKTNVEQDLVNAVLGAASGQPTPADSPLLTVRTRLKKGGLSTDSPLTNRETQVLRHISFGLKNREIGKSLGISVETVKEHVQNILRKLNVNDRTQAAVWAIQNSFI